MPTNNHSDNLFDGQAPLDDEQLWDLLSLYVDGEADPAQAAIVEQMLSSDPAYRRDFDFLMQSAQTMRMVEEVEPPLCLRDAVYAKTTGRPTLVGRLRAAWSRATTPSFGRYTTIAGAFAVAVLAAVIVWPHLTSRPGQGTTSPPVVAERSSSRPTVATNNVSTSVLPDIIVPDMGLIKLKPTPKAPVHKEFEVSVPSDKLNPATPLHPTSDKGGPKVATATGPGPRNHPVQTNNVTHPDNGPTQIPGGGGYAYDPKMDNRSAPDPVRTIVSPKDDIGPQVVVNDDTPTATAPNPPIPTPPNPDLTPKPGPTVDPPKKIIHVAVLPPDVSQNLRADALRRKSNVQYGGYDHSLADNGQSHEVGITIVKGTF